MPKVIADQAEIDSISTVNVLVQGAWLKLGFLMKISKSVNSQVGISVRGSRAGIPLVVRTE